MWIAMWEVLLALAPWLLLGAFVAALIHVVLPRDFVHRHLGGRFGVAKAVALGVPLPLCSCGVIPTGLGLKKDGASDGAVVGFLISTPQTGVDSILVSASFLGWPFAVFKVFSATLTGLVGGWLTDLGRDSRGAARAEPPSGARAPWPREMLDHGMMLLSTIAGWVVFGIVASAAITTLLPPDFFAGLAAHGPVVSFGAVLLVSLPLYVCATASVPIAAALVAQGLPPGAALVFLMAGPATNVATIGAIYRALGARALGAYLFTIIVGSVGLGLAFDFVLPASAALHVHDHSSATWWAVASALVVIALFAYFGFQRLRGLLRARTAEPAIELEVEGMSCGACTARVERILAGEAGVRAATVSLEPPVARILGAIDADAAVRAIERAGYRARRKE